MPQQINLLVCLSPSVSRQAITPISFYGIVTSVTRVLNIRIITFEGQIKAFVQVLDQSSADLVIQKLNGKLLNIGKIKVFISDKQFVNYTQSLEDILGGNQQISGIDLNMAPFQIQNSESKSIYRGFSYKPEFALNNEKTNAAIMRNSGTESALQTSIERIGKLDPCTELKAHKPSLTRLDEAYPSYKDHNYEVQTVSDGINKLKEHFIIKITHHEPTALCSKTVSKIFRRFGRIISLKFDHEYALWYIEYKSHKDVLKVLKAIDTDKLFGYKLSNLLKDDIKNNIATLTLEESKSTKIEDKIGKSECIGMISTQILPAIIKFSNLDHNLTFEDVCRLFSRIHVPIQITECLDATSQRYVYFAEFRHYHQAAEALLNMNQREQIRDSFRTTLQQYMSY